MYSVILYPDYHVKYRQKIYLRNLKIEFFWLKIYPHAHSLEEIPT